MDDLPKPAKNPIQAAKTTVRLIETLRNLDGARVTTLADELEHPKSSIHNYLSTLREEGYVLKDGNEYHVSLRFLEVGSLARKGRSIYDIARPEVADIARETGELANLLVEEHGKGVYLYREQGHKAVQVDSYTGQRVHLHNTALGKAILSNLPRERVDQILDEFGLPETTERTITNRETLYDELEEIRDRGVAFDDEEHLAGLRCIAAPILDKNETVEGAISVAGPSSRFQGETFRETLPERILNAKNIIELNITYG